MGSGGLGGLVGGKRGGGEVVAGVLRSRNSGERVWGICNCGCGDVGCGYWGGVCDW